MPALLLLGSFCKKQNRLRVKTPEPLICLVELGGIEPPTSSMPRKRAPSAPQPQINNIRIIMMLCVCVKGHFC